MSYENDALDKHVLSSVFLFLLPLDLFLLFDSSPVYKLWEVIQSYAVSLNWAATDPSSGLHYLALSANN